jgi:predicted phosphate transport protein (TIGR00153 family)
MSGFLQRLMPQETDFFISFQKQADNIVAGAAALTTMLEHYSDVAEHVRRIKAIEHAGDELTHQIFRKLNQTFVTPFDREDIHELCGTMDDVLDLVDAAASRFELYRIDQVRAGTVDLSKVLTLATMELSAAIHAIATSPHTAIPRVIEINRLENESDRLCRLLIARLFDDEKDPVAIIKWKEIFEVVEAAVDKCEDVSNVIESIILKNA